MLQLDLSAAIAAAKRNKAKVIAVQAPEGLKPRLPEIILELEGKTGAAVFAFADPCFGACDAADERAKALGADLLVHLGHSQLLPKNAVETVFLPLSHDFEKKKIAVLAERLAKMLKVEKLESAALCATIQFHPHLNELKKSLESRKIKCFIGKGRSVSCGQVLGCNYSAVKSAEKKADAVVFLGDGLFHPLGISFCTEKPVFAADPLQAEAKKIGGEMDLFFRKRTAMIEKARQAGAIAVWVSSKPGQRRMKVALELKKKIEEKGKMAFIFASDFINPDYILGVQAGAIVCTACPRIALDDSGSYRIPIVNPNEMLIALGEKKLEEYCFEEMQ